MQLLHRKDWLYRTFYTARQIGAGWSLHKCSLQLKTTSQRFGLEIIPGIMPRIPAGHPAFCLHSCATQEESGKVEPWRLNTLMQEEHKPFVTLQDNLVSVPVLALPRGREHLALCIDACDYQNDCVLMQEQPEGRKKPLSSWSRMLNTTEENYDTTHREFLAL